MHHVPHILDYCFLLPVRNEAAILPHAIATLLSYLQGPWKQKSSAWRVVVVDNGSNDATATTVASLSAQYGDVLTYYSTPVPGRGHAVAKAIPRYPARTYLYLDIDLPVELEDLPRYLDPLDANEADVVVGKRTGKRPLLRRLLTFGFKALGKILLDLPFSDPQSGIKALNARAALVFTTECRSSGYFRDTELLARSRAAGLRILETPIRWIEQRYPERTSAIHPFRDSARGFRDIWKLTGTLYPHMTTSLVLTGLAGATLLVTTLANMTLATLPGGVVAHGYPPMPSFIVSVAALSMGAFIFGWLAIRHAATRVPWRLLLILVLSITLGVWALSVATPPNRSQDVYWNLLLGRGLSEYGLNPYHTTPRDLAYDSWSSRVPGWRNTSMHLGPGWSLLMRGITVGTDSIQVALLRMKLVLVIALAGTTMLLWRLAGRNHAFAPPFRVPLLALILLNPFMLQMTLVDAHSDILVAFAIIASIMLLYIKQPISAGVVILLGASIKYAPLILLPLTFIEALRKGRRSFLQWLVGVGIVGILAIGGTYLLFGTAPLESSGIAAVLNLNQYPSAYSTIAGFLFARLPPDTILLMNIVVSFGAALIAGIWTRSYERAYFATLVVMLCVATLYLQPWYLVWLMPLAALVFPLGTVVGSALALLTPEGLSILQASVIALYMIILYLLMRNLVGRFNIK